MTDDTLRRLLGWQQVPTRQTWGLRIFGLYLFKIPHLTIVRWRRERQLRRGTPP